MNIFYTPNVTSGTYTLSEEESKHCIRVLRLSEGSIIQLIDGNGGFYQAEIITANPKKCSVKIIETIKNLGQQNFYLHMAVAPTKNIERFEWFLEKATEIGIHEITPIECEHSERSSVKTERLNKIIVSAMKQSIKAYLPKLNELIPYKNFITKKFNGKKMIAHCHEGKKELLKNIYHPQTNVLILIGPEGDFSPKEIVIAIENGFTEISLGKSRLRTETAALTACHTINLINENN